MKIVKIHLCVYLFNQSIYFKMVSPSMKKKQSTLQSVFTYFLEFWSLS